MHRLLSIFGTICFFFAFSQNLKAEVFPMDSIGLKVVDGKTYIMHKVDKGQSLYAISRRYKVSVPVIKEANQMEGNALSLGQLVLVPAPQKAAGISLKDYARKNSGNQAPIAEPLVESKPEKKEEKPIAVSSPPEKKWKNQESGSAKYHLVVKAQTLYSISKLNNVSVRQIKSWNSLGDTGLKIGQMLRVSEYKVKSDGKVVENHQTSSLKQEEITGPGKESIHVVRPGETLWAVSRKYSMTLKEIRALNKLTDTDIKEGQKLKVWTDGKPVVKAESVKKVKVANTQKVPVTNGNTPADKIFGSMEDKEEEEIDDSKELDVQNNNLKKWKVVIPPEAEARKIRIKGFGKAYWKVKEKGEAGILVASAAEQKKFYATHKVLPPGTIVQVRSPKTGQKVTVEILTRSDPDDTFLIRLSEKALLYLLLEKDVQEVQLNYTLPVDEK